MLAKCMSQPLSDNCIGVVLQCLINCCIVAFSWVEAVKWTFVNNIRTNENIGLGLHILLTTMVIIS